MVGFYRLSRFDTINGDRARIHPATCKTSHAQYPGLAHRVSPTKMLGPASVSSCFLPQVFYRFGGWEKSSPLRPTRLRFPPNFRLDRECKLTAKVRSRLSAQSVQVRPQSQTPPPACTMHQRDYH